MYKHLVQKRLQEKVKNVNDIGFHKTYLAFKKHYLFIYLLIFIYLFIY